MGDYNVGERFVTDDFADICVRNLCRNGNSNDRLTPSFYDRRQLVITAGDQIHGLFLQGPIPRAGISVMIVEFDVSLVSEVRAQPR